MRKIELSDYIVKVPMPDGTFSPKPYNVKESLIECLLHPALKLTGRELLSRNKLVMRIEAANGSILIEEADYNKLKQAFETIQGFTKSDMELVRRVLEAEDVNVKEDDRT